MNTLLSIFVGALALGAAGPSIAQNANMMDGGMGGYGWMGGYGGIWLPILLVVVVAGLVTWFVKQKGK